MSKVYLIGAGPGDSGLITQKALHLLSKAEVVFYDNLVNPAILDVIPSDAELIYVGKRGEGKSSEQKIIEDQIVQSAKKGKMVVRLKGGDPFIFGRGGEEAERLAEEKIPFEIVPGVTSPIAVPAYAGIPLTHRDFTSTVVFVTGRSSTESIDWPSLAKMGTLVFVMGVKTIRENMDHLIRAGRDPQEPCALIRWGTYPKQKTWVSKIGEIASIVEKEKIMPPAILVVGEVVRLREKINWFETKPLFGKRIVVTGERGNSLSIQLTDLGADVLEIPTLKISPPKSFKKLDQSIRQIRKYHWIVFTSVHGVKFFFERFQKIQKDLRKLSNCKIAVIGSSTAQFLSGYGIEADLIPKKFNSDALAREFSKLKIKGKKFLIPHAKEGKKDWIEVLKFKGAKVEVVEAYHVIPAQAGIPQVYLSPIDLITFISSSAVENFCRLVSTPPLQTPTLCIGPTTAKTAKKLGFQRVEKPPRATLEDLIAKILELLGK